MEEMPDVGRARAGTQGLRQSPHPSPITLETMTRHTAWFQHLRDGRSPRVHPTCLHHQGNPFSVILEAPSLSHAERLVLERSPPLGAKRVSRSSPKAELSWAVSTLTSQSSGVPSLRVSQPHPSLQKESPRGAYWVHAPLPSGSDQSGALVGPHPTPFLGKTMSRLWALSQASREAGQASENTRGLAAWAGLSARL